MVSYTAIVNDFQAWFGKEAKSSRYYHFLASFLRGRTRMKKAVNRGVSPTRQVLPITRGGWIMITVSS